MQSYIIDLAKFVLLLRMPGFNAGVAWGYIVGSSFLGFLLYDCLDVVMASVVALFLLPRQRGHKHSPYACLGIATAFKVLPLFVLPTLFLCDCHRNQKCALSGVAVFGLAAGGPVVLALIVIGSPALAFILYYAQRGIQIESTWAGLEVLATPICGDPIAYQAHGGLNLHSQLEASLGTLSLFLCILISIGSPLLLSRCYGLRSFATQTAAVLSGVLVVSKVFSPQYFVFLTPALAAAASESKDKRAIAWAMTALGILTTVVYPFLYGQLIALAWYAWAVLILRNILLSIVTLLLYRYWLRSKDHPENVQRKVLEPR